MKTKEKNTLVKIIVLGSLTITPIIFFWYAGYISLAALTASAFNNNNLDNLVEYSKNALHLFNIFFIEYLIYLFIIIINYILYKKKHPLILLIINSLIFIFIIADIIIGYINNGSYLSKDFLIYLLASIIGFILYFNLKKKAKN